MPRKKKTVYAFLDTNVYLHFKDFDQVDWREVLNSQSVCLVVAPVNLSELEKFKYDPISERRQKRSRMITKKITDIAFSVETGRDAAVPGRDGVVMRTLTASPVMSRYPQLEASNWDDQLIASVLRYAEENSAIPGEDIILVTDDSGVLIKGRANGITIQQPDDTLRLPDEPTSDQRKIAALERRLDEIESSQPKLRLAFIFNDNLTEGLRAPIEVIAAATEEELAQLSEQEQGLLLEQGKKRLARPKSTETTAPRTIADSLSEVQESLRFAMLGSISPAEYERYEREVKEYIEGYRRFLLDLCEWQGLSSRCRRVELAVLNEGTTPARGLVVHFTLPGGLGVETKQLGDPPDKPKEPRLPMNAVEMMGSIGMGSSLSPLLYDSLYRINSPPKPFDPDQAGPKITPHRSTLLEWTRSKAQHQLTLRLTPFWILFPAVEGERRYEFHYKIFAENIPSSPVEGSLSITCVGTPVKFNPS
jgi:PIN domain